MMTDPLHVVHARAAGLDVHKMQITASVRLCTPGAGEPQVETRTFEALASGLDEMVAWLRERCVDAAVMEGTGIYWLAPFEALENAGIPATLVNARQVKQLRGRKTDVADSVWLARVAAGGPQPLAQVGGARVAGVVGRGPERRFDDGPALLGPVRLGLHVSPVGDRAADSGGRRVAALVLMVDPARLPRIDAARVGTMLGLTPSEARLSALLAEGLKVREVAATAGWSENYVRWLIRQVYRKLGASGQVDLVRQVLAVDALPRR